ncbi:MAG: PDZ domain-containing protein [Pirellulales bacterium]
MGISVGKNSCTVYGVSPFSPAANAGIKIYDRILSLDGAAVANSTELFGAANRIKLGATVAVTLTRNGKKVDAQIAVDNF